MALPKGLSVIGPMHGGFDTILTYDALEFLAQLHRKFDGTRRSLMAARETLQKQIDAGQPIKFPVADHCLSWSVAPIPQDLQRRHVEITGPTDRKMVINALNSGSDMFMADFEDSLSPTWKNSIEGQINMLAANKRTIEFKNPDGSIRKLKDQTACLLVRVRGWHLDEKHIICDDKPMAGALVDFGLYFFHNVAVRLANGTAPYFYLPKMESRFECRLWNEIFQFAEDYMKVKRGTIRATIMVETLLAAVEMEEMLYELRDYACGMNAGRWDYIFSAIKRLQSKPEAVFPDRKLVTMTVPFMKAYTDRLVKVCHSHGASAMGGMSAFIPSRRDPEVNRIAIEQVTTDKEREVVDGFDGTWVAHPDLVKLARDIFVKGLNGKDNQIEKKRDDVIVCVDDLITIKVENGFVSEAGARLNISVALQYLNSWLQGVGAVAINNLMEDAATAEISRGQLWQWLRHKTKLNDGRTFSVDLYNQFCSEELEKLGGKDKQKFGHAATLLNKLILSPSMDEFLTLSAYEVLTQDSAKLS
ncbi:malate synthase-like isoform X1 [Rhopilema esculentum]|uniref:malate synthase-like isoform X1 n=2 Tax=Rhopilema esculentum TaxID=499914 RepID=UPI0031CF5083